MSQLMKEAKAAIDKVFSDMSVTQTTTLDRMSELRDHVDECMEALRNDMEAEESE